MNEKMKEITKAENNDLIIFFAFIVKDNKGNHKHNHHNNSEIGYYAQNKAKKRDFKIIEYAIYSSIKT